MQKQPLNKEINSFTTNSQDIEGQLQNILKQIGQKYLNMAEGELQTLSKQKNIDYALGCMFGSFLGDSIGSYCQFQTKQYSLMNVKDALKMVGGGPFQLKPGQVTDDSQLALHLLLGLLHYNKIQNLQSQLPLLLVAISKQYLQWLNNIPFDIGSTCRAAFQILQDQILIQQQGPTNQQKCKQQYQQLKKAFEKIAKKNYNSLSNGFLMRIAPLICFASFLIKYKGPQEYKSLLNLIKEQTFMTHGNPLCTNANFHFIQFVMYLINRTSHQQLFIMKKSCEQRINKNKESINKDNLTVDQILISFQKQAWDDYQTNKQNNNKNDKLLTADNRNAGFFKIAYYYSFYSFFEIVDNCKNEQDLKPEVFKKVLKFVIEQGGDTDTNACIAGALVGSIVGFSRLPKQYLVKIFKLRLGQSQFRQNQTTYQPINGFVNLIKLYKKFI